MSKGKPRWYPDKPQNNYDEFPLPDWGKDCDPNLSGKLSGITVKNW